MIHNRLKNVKIDFLNVSLWHCKFNWKGSAAPDSLQRAHAWVILDSSCKHVFNLITKELALLGEHKVYCDYFLCRHSETNFIWTEQQSASCSGSEGNNNVAWLPLSNTLFLSVSKFCLDCQGPIKAILVWHFFWLTELILLFLLLFLILWLFSIGTTIALFKSLEAFLQLMDINSNYLDQKQWQLLKAVFVWWIQLGW